MTYLLDTNVVSELGSPAPHDHLKVWKSSVNESLMALSVLSLAEMRRGVEKLRAKTTGDISMRERRLDAVVEIELVIDSIKRVFGSRILPVTVDVADEWGRLRARKDTDRFDLGIVATAKRNGLTVVTRNHDDFRQRGVRVLNPFSRPPKVFEPGE
jgi:hypothetical protein